MTKPVIFHIDFDCYFVSAARTIQPELNNQPVAISRSSAHAIAVSVSYELRNKGVKAGMKNFEIKEIEPKTIFVASDMQLYEDLSSKIFEYIALEYSGNLQIASIDECYIDVSELIIQRRVTPIQLAQKLQRDILNKFRIPISIGISHNKFLAKMTTNISKPFGIGFTDENNFEKSFFDLDIEKYHGIGKKTAAKLRSVNINTIGDLASKKVSDLEINAIFGRVGQNILKNLDPSVYEHISFQDEQAIGIGNEITFEDYSLPYELKIEHLLKLCEKVSNRLKKENLAGNVITLTIRFRNKKWSNKQIKIQNYINDKSQIYLLANNLFLKYFSESDFIGIGVRVSGLRNIKDIYVPQSLLKNNLSHMNQNIVSEIITQVNDLFANPTLKILSEEEIKTKRIKQGKYRFKKILFRK
ncbi:Y-family DNA polymerase [Mycoplasma seminis]|uniref:DNA polymerase IV n=1 Tax=Mycoplasma seminis TaxID=512749 RepID=A0ABY9HBL6_9MOLU|nr:DNA polymerase IV [Mycoplasma seminis]WLP85932.1 DNA polymerase IV [Mycoplasma seminis]